MKVKITAIFIFLFLSIVKIYANDHQVYPGQSIQAAINLSASGDRVLVHSGTYSESLVIQDKSNFTLTSAGDGEAIIQGNGTVENAIRVTNFSNVTISNLTVKNIRKQTWSTGIYVEGVGSGLSILNNNVTDVSYKSGAFDPTDNPRKRVQGANPILVAGTDISNPMTNVLVSGNTVSYCMTGWSEALTVKASVNGFEISNNYVHHITNIGIDAYGLGDWPNAAQVTNGVIKNNIVHDAICNYTDNGGIYVDGGSNITISNNKVYNSKFGYTIGCENQSNLPNATTFGIKIVNNLAYNNLRPGIMIGTSGDDNGGQGDVVDCLITGNTFLKNTTADQWGGEIVLQNCNNIEMYNNIFYGLFEMMIQEGPGKGTVTSGNNLFFNTLGLSPTSSQAITNWQQIDFATWKNQNSDITSINIDPLLVNASPTAPDFHLQASSPAINAGRVNFTPLGGEVDIDGQPRIQNSRVDIGVDESGTSSTVAVTGVSVTPISTSVSVGGTAQLTNTISPINATNQNVTWSTNNASIATVSNSGLVTGVTAGTAIITVTTQDGGFIATSTITVTSGSIAVTGVSVSPLSASIPVAGTSQLTATVSPSNATNRNVTWSSGNSAIATVSSTGLVTGVAAGSTVITVTTADGGFTATSNITVTSTGGGLPSPWLTTDIGAVAATGSASYSSGVFEVAGSGADIATNSDEFRYVYQTLNGDGEIVARVNSLTNTNSLAKAGVMIRQGLSSGEKYGMVAVTPGGEIVSQLHGNGTQVTTNQAAGTAPVWVKVVRIGGTLNTFYSTNGTSWTQLGTKSVGLTTSVYAGLVVTSHNDGVLCIAQFDNVSLGNNGARLSKESDLERRTVNVFPTMFQDKISIDLGELDAAEIAIYNLEGKLVYYTFTKEAVIEIPASEFELIGVGIVRVISGQLDYSFKVIH